jgi:hypothetical protein
MRGFAIFGEARVEVWRRSRRSGRGGVMEGREAVVLATTIMIYY